MIGFRNRLGILHAKMYHTSSKWTLDITVVDREALRVQPPLYIRYMQH